MILLGFLADLDNPNPGFDDGPEIGFLFGLVTVLLIWAALSSKNDW